MTSSSEGGRLTWEHRVCGIAQEREFPLDICRGRIACHQTEELEVLGHLAKLTNTIGKPVELPYEVFHRSGVEPR